MPKLLTLAPALLLLSACGGEGTVLINGAGATFPNIIYQKWVVDYNAAHPGVEINYQSIGSGGGISQFTSRTVNFGASDAPVLCSELLFRRRYRDPQSGFCRARKRLGDGDRILRCFDQLHTEREPAVRQFDGLDDSVRRARADDDTRRNVL